MANILFNNVTISHPFNYGNATSVNYEGLRMTNMVSEFENNTNVISVSNINDNVTNMYRTFYNSSLTSIDKLPNSVTDMDETFSWANLVVPPSIPSSVINMDYSFHNNYEMKSAPDMSNATNVTNMSLTFYFCNNMINTPDLSNCKNLTNMMRTFAYCYNMTETPIIPETVKDMRNIFQGCTSITSLPSIPNSVTDISYSFYQTYNVTNCNINIPSQITNMYSAFERSGVKGKIFIESSSVTNAVNCFINTTANKSVYIPFTYENGVNTSTYNAFISAGYDETGTTNGVTLLDINSYVPPIHYDFDEGAELATKEFSWDLDLSTAKEESSGITTVSTDGLIYGANMSYKESTYSDRNEIAHTSNKETSPGDESYVGFLFNVASGGLFQPTTLSFKTSKNGTSGGSVMVTLKYDTSDEITVGAYATIARNSETPSFTEATIDLTQFDMGVTKGSAMLKFYLYNQGNTKTFSLIDVKLSGLLETVVPNS